MPELDLGNRDTKEEAARILFLQQRLPGSLSEVHSFYLSAGRENTCIYSACAARGDREKIKTLLGL